MARLVTFGAETGHIGEAGVDWGSGSASIPITHGYMDAFGNTSNGIRTGDWALRVWNSGTGQKGRLFAHAAASELFFFLSLCPFPYSWGDTSLIRFYEGTTLHIALTVPTAGSTAIDVKRNTTVLETSVAGVIASNVRMELLGHVLIHDTTGRVEIWADGVKIIDYTGDTRNAGTAGTIDNIVFPAHSTRSFVIDDFKVNDASGSNENSYPNAYGIVMVRPAAAGDVTQLTPTGAASGWEATKDAPPDTASYVASGTADQYDLYQLDDIASLYDEVTLVQPICYGALAAAGTGAVRNRIKSGATEATDAADSALTTAAAFKRGDVLYVDPADSAAWTIAKVNALQGGPVVK